VAELDLLVVGVADWCAGVLQGDMLQILGWQVIAIDVLVHGTWLFLFSRWDRVVSLMVHFVRLDSRRSL